MPRTDPRRSARRLRALGVVVLAAGLGGAALVYWTGTHRTEPTIEELLPGLRAARARQTGLLYGHAVLSLWEVWQDLKEPAGEATVVAASGALGAALCFRVAWLKRRGDAES